VRIFSLEWTVAFCTKRTNVNTWRSTSPFLERSYSVLKRKLSRKTGSKRWNGCMVKSINRNETFLWGCCLIGAFGNGKMYASLVIQNAYSKLVLAWETKRDAFSGTVLSRDVWHLAYAHKIVTQKIWFNCKRFGVFFLAHQSSLGNIRALSGTWTHDPSNRAAADLRLRLHGHRDRLVTLIVY
jgi:hypothetical protein